MKVELNDMTMIMQFENKDEERTIKSFLTYKDESAAFGRGGFDIRRIKNVCMGKDITDKGIKETYFVCFAGFCREILQEAKKEGVKVSSFDDKRKHFAFQKADNDYASYFDPKFKYTLHQQRALSAMVGTNTGILKLPTSAGKSFIMAAFCKISGLPTLVLNDRATLVMQLYDTFKGAGLNVGYCTGKGIKDGDIVVSTIQSVKKIPDFTKFKCVIVDEVQRASSKTFQEFMKSVSFPLKYGFSASPSNGNLYDFAKIRQFFGSIIIDVKAEELIENEVMSKPHIHMVETLCDETMDYPSAYDLGIVHNDRRNKKIIDIADRYDSGVAILISHIDQGKILNDNIKGSVFIKGDTPLDERMRIMKDFDEGKIRVLIGSSILNEGISIDNIRHLIMASGGKAQTQTVQKIGRALRLTPEKKEADFFDFIDEGNRFLSKHSKQRITLYKKEGFVIEDVERIEKEEGNGKE